MGAPDTRSGSAPKRSDEAQAVRFLALKAAIFILVPLAAAGLAVAFLMPK